MKILVTGACGRIGQEVTKQLCAQGHEVLGFDIHKNATLIEGAKYVQGSLLNIKDIKNLVQEVEAIAHLAAQMSWDPKDEDEMLQNNVTGSFNLLQCAAQHSISRFVFASTGEVYPEVAPLYQPIDETHPLEPTSFYGETKRLGEDMVLFFQQRRALPAVILRFPHTQNAKELLNPSSFFSGPRFFLQSKIKQMRNLNKNNLADFLSTFDSGKLQHILQCDEKGNSYAMHISDVRDTAQAVVLGLTHPSAVGEIFNATTNAPVVFSDILPKMAAITGCEIVNVQMPGAGVHYHTLNNKIVTMLGYTQKYSFEDMLIEAAKKWKSVQHNT